MRVMLQRVGCLAIALGVALASSGCVTGATLIRGRERMNVPLIVGAIAADLVVTAVATYQIQSYSAEASVATTLAVTGVDVGIACIAGGCSALRP